MKDDNIDIDNDDNKSETNLYSNLIDYDLHNNPNKLLFSSANHRLSEKEYEKNQNKSSSSLNKNKLLINNSILTNNEVINKYNNQSYHSNLNNCLNNNFYNDNLNTVNKEKSNIYYSDTKQLSHDYSKLVEESALCPICLKLAEDAIETECCGSIFCQKCIDRIEKDSCPCCRYVGLRIHPSLAIRKLIKNFPAKCSYNCGFIGTIENIKKHYFDCSLRDFTCNIHKCGCIYKKSDYLQHLINYHSEVLINVGENFDKIFNSKIQKKIKESDFKNTIKDKNEIIIYNGNSNKLNNLTIMRPSYFDEIIEFDDIN